MLYDINEINPDEIESAIFFAIDKQGVLTYLASPEKIDLARFVGLIELLKLQCTSNEFEEDEW